MLSKIGLKISQELKHTFLPTMLKPGPSKQPSTCLPLLQQHRVLHQRPTSVPFSQARPLNKRILH